MTDRQPRSPRPHLDAPPIVEVACSFCFEPLDGFDLFHLGRFWGELADEYPHRQAQRPIVEVGAPPLESSGQPQLRAWLWSNGVKKKFKADLMRFVLDSPTQQIAIAPGLAG